MPRVSERTGVLISIAIAVAVCALSWSAEFQRCQAWGLPLDDAWIHCQIARNFVSGHGWGINPGDPVQCSSGPLWTLLLVGGFAAFGVHVWVAKALCVLVFLATVVQTGRLASALGGSRTLAAILAATCGTLAWHGLSGMETALAALLVVSAIEQACGPRHILRATLLAALACMARPEVFVLVVFMVAAGSRMSRRHGLLCLAVAFVTLVPYICFNYAISGTPVPTTFAAKVGGVGLLRALGSGDLTQLRLALTLAPYLWFVRWVSFLGFMNVGLLLLCSVGALQALRTRTNGWLGLAMLVVFPLARGVLAPTMNPSFHYGPYVGALLPVVLALAAVGAAPLLHRPIGGWRSKQSLWALGLVLLVAVAAIRLEAIIPPIGRNTLPTLGNMLLGGRITTGIDPNLQMERVGLLLVAAIAALLFVLQVAPGRAVRVLTGVVLAGTLALNLHRLTGLPAVYAGNVLDIQAMDVAMGQWIHEHAGKDDVLAVNDLGAISFFGRRPVVDLLGLATPSVAPFVTSSHLATLVPVRRLRPTLGVIFTAWFASWVDRPSLILPLHTIRLSSTSVIAGRESIVFRADWNTFSEFYSDSLLLGLDPVANRDTPAAAEGRLLRSLGLPTRAQLFAKAGDYERNLRDWLDAERYYRRALSIDPDEGAAWSGLVSVWRRTRGTREMESLLQEQAERRPLDAGARMALGDWFLEAGRAPEARTAWTVALKMHPDSATLLDKLARLSAAEGDSAAADVFRKQLAKLDGHGVR